MGLQTLDKVRRLPELRICVILSPKMKQAHWQQRKSNINKISLFKCYVFVWKSVLQNWRKRREKKRSICWFSPQSWVCARTTPGTKSLRTHSGLPPVWHRNKHILCCIASLINRELDVERSRWVSEVVATRDAEATCASYITAPAPMKFFLQAVLLVLCLAFLFLLNKEKSDSLFLLKNKEHFMQMNKMNRHEENLSIR